MNYDNATLHFIEVFLVLMLKYYINVFINTKQAIDE